MYLRNCVLTLTYCMSVFECVVSRVVYYAFCSVFRCVLDEVCARVEKTWRRWHDGKLKNSDSKAVMLFLWYLKLTEA